MIPEFVTPKVLVLAVAVLVAVVLLRLLLRNLFARSEPDPEAGMREDLASYPPPAPSGGPYTLTVEGLPARLRLLRAWVRRALAGYWTHGGYLNWDTGLGFGRWHQTKKFALAQQALEGVKFAVLLVLQLVGIGLQAALPARESADDAGLRQDSFPPG